MRNKCGKVKEFKGGKITFMIKRWGKIAVYLNKRCTFAADMYFFKKRMRLHVN